MPKLITRDSSGRCSYESKSAEQQREVAPNDTSRCSSLLAEHVATRSVSMVACDLSVIEEERKRKTSGRR